jgi:hypothetical protein
MSTSESLKIIGMNRLLRFFGILLLIFCNCARSEKTEYKTVIEEWIGKKIILPKLSNQFNYDEKVKVVTQINGNCLSCISRLELWSSFIDEIRGTCETNNVQYYLYISGADTSAFKAINDSIIHFNYPVIFDQDNTFSKLNKLHENSLYHTMLLDSLDRVLLIGTPIMNKKLQKLYIDEISRILTGIEGNDVKHLFK